MNVDETFRRNLIAKMHERGMNAAELSRSAGLNARAVKDIEEGRAKSPKLSTAFALAAALHCDPGELVGLGPRPALLPDLVRYLSQYDLEAQEQILNALRALPTRPA